MKADITNMDKNKILFDELWTKEERYGLQSRLQRDYPGWLHRRRVRRASLASMAVLVVAGFLTINNQSSNHKGYDDICCNRATFPESHWADVAANILITPTI